MRSTRHEFPRISSHAQSRARPWSCAQGWCAARPVLHAQAAYRKFRQEFVRSAAQEGMPEELAQHIAHGLRPAEYLSALHKEKDKAGLPTG